MFICELNRQKSASKRQTVDNKVEAVKENHGNLLANDCNSQYLIIKKNVMTVVRYFCSAVYLLFSLFLRLASGKTSVLLIFHLVVSFVLYFIDFCPDSY